MNDKDILHKIIDNFYRAVESVNLNAKSATIYAGLGFYYALSNNPILVFDVSSCERPLDVVKEFVNIVADDFTRMHCPELYTLHFLYRGNLYHVNYMRLDRVVVYMEFI